jgi:protein PhnA
LLDPLPPLGMFPGMAKGYDQHQQRLAGLNHLGKDLARRAKSKCELTGESGVPLHIYEVPPSGADPDLDRCLMISPACREAIEKPKSLAGQQWRTLAETIWAELPAAQVMAWRMLSVLARNEDWARETLENSTLDPKIEEWARASPL